MRKYILIDACVAAAAFAPTTTRSIKLANRAEILLKGTSSVCEPQFLIPSFCIGETFAVFEKYRWGASWNPHVKASTRLNHGKFTAVRNQFHKSIHNGAKLLQIELNRYHVLCMDLIAPINAAYRIKRDRKVRGKQVKKNVSPASTYDLLFIGMGIWLQKQLGRENFLVVTGDERVALVIRRAKSEKLAEPMTRHLRQLAKGIGVTYGPGVYPEVVDLARADKGNMTVAFPGWKPTW